MVIIGPALGHDIDDRPGVASKFRLEVGGQQPELLHRIGAQLEARRTANRYLIIIRAIERHVIFSTTVSIDAETETTAESLRRSRSRFDHSRLKQRQLKYVAPIQRQSDHAARINRRAECRRF